jgi:hypothetical protein
MFQAIGVVQPLLVLKTPDASILPDDFAIVFVLGGSLDSFHYPILQMRV